MTDALRSAARTQADRAHAPYSQAPAGAAVLLDDGRLVGAPRVESASFPLTIPALQGAWALAALTGRALRAAALSRPFTDAEVAFLAETSGAPWVLLGPDLAAPAGVPLPAPMPGDAAPSVPGVFAFAGDAIAGTTEAMRTTAQAVVPVSDFRVGAVAVDADGRAVAGANVEHPLDWTRGLCAERVALVAARAAGLGPLTRVYLACATADDGTPCGGCRQLLAEQAPGA
jgi:cytidine deaminase